MSKAIALVALLAAVFAATAIAGNPDPRKCHWNNARQCGGDAATLAVRHALAKHLGTTAFYGDVTCLPRGSKFLLWGCTMKTSPGLPKSATVKFWATSTGWHTRLTLS
jgi:hypothetical protein